MEYNNYNDEKIIDDFCDDDSWDDWSNYDHCYECSGYGDDYFINEDGELESACPECPFYDLHEEYYED